MIRKKTLCKPFKITAVVMSLARPSPPTFFCGGKFFINWLLSSVIGFRRPCHNGWSFQSQSLEISRCLSFSAPLEVFLLMMPGSLRTFSKKAPPICPPWFSHLGRGDVAKEFQANLRQHFCAFPDAASFFVFGTSRGRHILFKCWNVMLPLLP